MVSLPKGVYGGFSGIAPDYFDVIFFQKVRNLLFGDNVSRDPDSVPVIIAGGGSNESVEAEKHAGKGKAAAAVGNGWLQRHLGHRLRRQQDSRQKPLRSYQAVGISVSVDIGVLSQVSFLIAAQANCPAPGIQGDAAGKIDQSPELDEQEDKIGKQQPD